MHTHLVGLFWDHSVASRLGDTGLVTQERLRTSHPSGRQGGDRMSWQRPSRAWTEYSNVI